MTARTSRRHGADVDEGTVALVRFPDERLAHLHTSFGEEPTATLRIFGEEGRLRAHPRLSPRPRRRRSHRRGAASETLSFEPTDQFAAELSLLLQLHPQDREPEPSGIEGLQDVRMVEAIYRSARDGRPVTLPRLARPEAGAVSSPDFPNGMIDRRQVS